MLGAAAYLTDLEYSAPNERHLTTGLVHRVPVCRLADEFWDCYREEELQVA